MTWPVISVGFLLPHWLPISWTEDGGARWVVVVGLASMTLVMGTGSASAGMGVKVRSPEPGPMPHACPASAAFSPKTRPAVAIRRLQRPIQVDGRLDDAAWRTAARISGFTEIRPGDQQQPPVCTEAWIGYDDTHLYVAFRAFDRPDEIRASLRNRDEIFQDDFVGILIDPFGDASQAYEIFANPLGIQGELLMRTGGGEDIGFDLVYASDGQVTRDGYVVEMAIPFSSLRFPDRDVQEWRTTFMRTRPRSSRQQFSWSTVDRDEPCFMCQFGTMTGLENIRRSTSLDLMPGVVGTQSAAADGGGAMENDRMRVEPSFTLRYGITPSAGAEVTVNPDFSQVESDAARVDVNSTFGLFFPERRPFFQEGSDLFETPVNVVYTRSINAPSVAGKTTGRVGRTSVAVLSAVDEETPMVLPFAESSTAISAGRSTSQIVRVRQSFGETSFAGVTLTDQRLLDASGSGSLASADAGVQVAEQYRLEGQVVLSRVREPNRPVWTADNETIADADAFSGYTPTLDGDRFWGAATHLRFRRMARHYNVSLTGQQVTPAFRAPNGFQQRTDYRRVSLWQGYSIYRDGGWLERIEPAVYGRTEWRVDGTPQEAYAQVQVWSLWAGQTRVFANLGMGREVFRGRAYERLTNWNVNVHSNFSQPVRLGGGINGGRAIYRSDVSEVGRELNASVWATLQPTQRLIVEPRVQYASLQNGDEVFYEGYISRVRTGLQVTRALSARVVTQYDHFSGSVVLEPLVSYEINPFTVFYVGSRHDYTSTDGATSGSALHASSRQFFFKFQYLLRV